VLATETVNQIARRLNEAEASRTQIRQLSLEIPELSVKDAYAIQRAWVALKIAAGRTIRGHKIGLTSRAMQRAVNITEPDYGALLDDMFFSDGSTVPAGRFIDPRVEVELAFVLGKELRGAGCTIFDVLAATDYVVPAIEIIDARIQRIDPTSKVSRKVTDTISDNAANAGVVFGGRPVRPFDIDLRWASALLYKNEGIEDSGVAAAVLNHPANGIAWLVNRLAEHDVGLKSGRFILSGSFTSPLPVKAGDTIRAEYRELGSIGFTFI
jgi:2-oxo-hept-3-ene-1,7-dioate hydratase